jgi:formylmethanofuran dehydrogenase subunit E
LRVVEEPKQRVWSQELYDRAVEFHGHGGPFMIIGLRMGILALERLDSRGWFDISCRAMLHWRPPDSCIIDGIQSSTGCTTGKHNLVVEEGEDVAAEFRGGEKTVLVKPREPVLSTIRKALSEDHPGEAHGDEAEGLMRWLRDVPVAQLFEVFET